MTAAPQHSIGIIGGGFTGAAFAVHLARAAPRALAIEIVEPRERVGAGLAYGSCEAGHRINVPSDRMVVFAEDREHFSRWLKTTGAWDADPGGMTASGEHYSTRRDFGLYAGDLVRETTASNPSGSTIAHRRTRATGLTREGGGWRVAFEDGGSALYGHVVFCASHAAPPFRWPLEEGAEALPHLVRNPWAWDAIKAIPDKASVIVIGTGLTMCDAVVSLRARGHRGHIRAISRRALTPRPHAEFDRFFDLFEGHIPPATALGLLRFVRKRAREVEAEGRTWHIVVDSLRRHLANYWRTLPLVERVKIARRLRAHWDVHRFRIAPQVFDIVERGRSEGWLEIASGHIHSIANVDGRFGLNWTPRHGDRTITPTDAIINCTGPDPDLGRTQSPFLQDAVRQGLIRADALRVGIDVDGEGRVIGRSGEPGEGLWAAGPFARAMVGEATGAPEASIHARVVAGALATKLA
jgi:uncharacterized NAD(P)/FAD-binding protein YdhS